MVQKSNLHQFESLVVYPMIYSNRVSTPCQVVGLGMKRQQYLTSESDFIFF